MAGGAHDADCRSGGRPEGGCWLRPGFPSTLRIEAASTHRAAVPVGREAAPTRRRTARHLSSPGRTGYARSAGIARLHRRELANRLGLRGLSGSGRVHGPWLRRGNAGDSAVGRAGAIYLLGRFGHTRIGHTKPRPVEDAVLGIGADGRADAAVPSRSVGFRGPAKCRAGTCAADARRTVALSRAETTALGSERTSGAGAHRLELRLGRARGVTEDWALDRVSPHLAILARDPRARNVHMLVEQQIAERRERARDSIAKILERPSNGPYGDYRIKSASRKTYRVAMRGPGLFENYCSCPDFAVNTLGTCKHIEALLLRLRKRHGPTLESKAYARARLHFFAVWRNHRRPPALAGRSIARSPQAGRAVFRFGRAVAATAFPELS